MIRTKLLCLLAFASLPLTAGSVLYQSSFSADDSVALLPFSVSGAGVVTIESYGYAGGVAPGGAVISEGGFAPNAILFDSTGSEIAGDNGGHCAITGASTVTGNCDDPYIQESLGAGSYTLALLEWDNTTTDGTLADGFRQDGNPGFTCAEFGATGNFCDVTTALGTIRNANYALAITAETLVVAALPEPSTFSLLIVAGILIAGILRLRIRRTV